MFVGVPIGFEKAAPAKIASELDHPMARRLVPGHRRSTLIDALGDKFFFGLYSDTSQWFNPNARRLPSATRGIDGDFRSERSQLGFQPDCGKRRRRPAGRQSRDMDSPARSGA